MATAAPQRTAAEPTGTIFLEKYRIETTIGQGGMGIVVKARHLGLDELVAIKYLKPQFMNDRDIVARFEREGRAAAKLKSEHVVRIHDVGRLDGGVPYIIMEYFEGADLAAIIETHGAQQPSVCVDVMMQACLALAEAHAFGIIHRDVKPANFFITQRPGEPPRLKMLDFGIATAPDGAGNLTNPSVFIGTPAYVSPEQMRKPRDADARSDIWSMGIVLFEMLEGKSPFKGRGISEMYSAVCREKMPAMSPRVPAQLQAIVQRCLEKDPDKRYQSAAELARDLAPHATEPVAAYAQLAECRRLSVRGSQQHAVQEPNLTTGKIPREAIPPSASSPELVAAPNATPTPAAVPASRRRSWIAASIGGLTAVLVCVILAAPARFENALGTAIPAVTDAARNASTPRPVATSAPNVVAPAAPKAVAATPAPAATAPLAAKPAPRVPLTTGAEAPVAPSTIKTPAPTARTPETPTRRTSSRRPHREKITIVDEEDDDEPTPSAPPKEEMFERRR